MAKRMLFIGAGAIGSYLGSFLARAGHDVTLVDPWPEQVEMVRRRGISVTGPHDPFEAQPTALHVHELQRLGADFDIAFIAMKAYDTAWATWMALPHLKPEGYVVSAQNCWNDPIVASIAGAERSVGLIMSKIGVALWKAGEVERGMEKGQGAGHDVFRAGEHDGRITERVTELADIISVVDGARPTDNLWGERWSKLCANCMGNPVQAMTGLGSRRSPSRRAGARSPSASRRSPPRSASSRGTASPSSTAARPSSGPRPAGPTSTPSSTPGSSPRKGRAATGARRWPRT